MASNSLKNRIKYSSRKVTKDGMIGKKKGLRVNRSPFLLLALSLRYQARDELSHAFNRANFTGIDHAVSVHGYTFAH